jgi:glutamate transport system substrate-binding protein
MRRRTALALAVLVLSSAAACGGVSADPSPITPQPSASVSADLPAVVHVGVGTDIPGLGLLNITNNARSGFDIDLMNWLGNNMSPAFTPVPVDVTLDDRIGELTGKQVQLVVDAFSITDQRREQIGFAGPYLLTQQGVLVRSDDKRIRVKADLAGKTVCAQRGSTSLAQLNQSDLRNQITITEAVGTKECVDKLLSKPPQVDALSTDQLVLYGFANSDTEHRLAVVPGLTFGAQERYGIGLPHGKVALCQALTMKLQQFITSGAWDSFFRSYFPNLTPADYKPQPFKLDDCRQ